MADPTDLPLPIEEAAVGPAAAVGAVPAPAGGLPGVEYAVLGTDTITPLDYAPAPTARWQVGTLAYTTGGLILLFCLLLGGDFALSMRERSVGQVVQLMLKRLHASDTLMASLLSTVPTALSMLIGPVVSYRSDRFRSRWGRRIPFLLVPTPIAALAMVAVAYSEDFGAILQRLLGSHSPSYESCALICFAVSWTLFECAAIISASLVGALVNDVVPRAVLGRFFGLFRQVSLAAGIIFNYWIFKHAESYFHVIFLTIGGVFFVGFSVMCLTVREGDYPPPPPAEAGQGLARAWLATRSYLRQSFRHGYYRWVFLAMTLSAVTFLPINLFSLLYAKQLNVSLEAYGQWIALTYLISFFLASPIGVLVDRAHTLRVSIAVLVLYAVLMAGFGYFIRDAHTFGIALVVHGVLSGCYFTSASPLGQVLFPRIAFAQYASAGSLVASIFTIVMAPLLGRLLDLSGHDYRLTFFASALIGLSAAGTFLVVYTHFNRFGGHASYLPPGEAAEVAA